MNRIVLKLANAGSIHTIRWANALAARDWTVHLVSLEPPLDGLDERVALHRPPGSPPAGYFLNAPYVRRLLRAMRPDLVHAHYVSGYGTLGALAAPSPLIVSVWGSDIYEFPERSPLHRWLVSRNLARATLVMSTSEAMAARTRQFTDREVGITPFGIDLERFRPKGVESPFAPSDIVIGTVKSLAPRYGIEYLIRAFGIVRRRRPELPLKLLVVGGGPQEGELRRLADALQISDHTVFAGSVDHRRAADFHNMLSIAVFPSEQESFGVSVLEASASEKPVVVSNVGGLPEVVEDGVTGLVVRPRDPAATAEAIDRLVLDPALRLRMGRAGRERVARLYAWEHCVDLMLGYYERVALRRGVTPR